MLVDTAALLLLASSTQPALRRHGTHQMQAPAGAQLMNMPQIYNNPQNVALLMESLIVESLIVSLIERSRRLVAPWT